MQDFLDSIRWKAYGKFRGLPMFQLIASVTPSGGLGVGGDLLFHSKPDLNFFRQFTLGNIVIMGRKTWEGLPPSNRPLKGRVNIIITSRPEDLEDAFTYSSGELVCAYRTLEEALQRYYSLTCRLVVIGGAKLFRYAIQLPQCAAVVLNRWSVDRPDADCFFPELDTKGSFIRWSPTAPIPAVEDVRDGVLPGGGVSFTTEYWYKPVETFKEAEHSEEWQYLDLVRRVLQQGDPRMDRTGTGVWSIFGAQSRYSLRDGTFPLLTTKTTWFKGVWLELLWFIQGCTDARVLSDQGVHIWDENGSREVLDALGFPERKEGDLGPVYGFQWRHFGAKYRGAGENYDGEGVDQLREIIRQIKEEPTSRRIVLSAWNPSAIPEMALPPCHVMCQFYVSQGELSCQLYQRSCDLGLGVPFNIASYSLLTILLAKTCNLKPGEFIHSMGDAHVYTNHADPLRLQFQRLPRKFPKLWINPEVTDLFEFTKDDVRLEDYKPHRKIYLPMAV